MHETTRNDSYGSVCLRHRCPEWLNSNCDARPPDVNGPQLNRTMVRIPPLIGCTESNRYGLLVWPSGRMKRVIGGPSRVCTRVQRSPSVWESANR